MKYSIQKYSNGIIYILHGGLSLTKARKLLEKYKLNKDGEYKLTTQTQ